MTRKATHNGLSWLVTLAMMVIVSMIPSHAQTITPSAPNQVNVTDGAGGYSLQPYSNAAPSSAGINVVAYGAVGDGTTNNTVAFGLASAVANTTGQCLFIPAGRFVTDTISLTSATPCMGGIGNYQSFIIPLNGDTAFSPGGTTEISSMYLHDFAILNNSATAGDGNGYGIYLSPAHTLVSQNIVVERVLIQCSVGKSIYLPSSFSVSIRDTQACSKTDNDFDVEGDNSTLLERTYALDVGTGKAGYRIHSGVATIIAGNGLNATHDQEDWLVAGDNMAEDGVIGFAKVTCIGCNVEGWTRYGMRTKVGSNINLNNTLFTDDSIGIAAGTVEALYLEYAIHSTIDTLTAISDPVAGAPAYTNNQAIHTVSSGSPFILNNNPDPRSQSYYADPFSLVYNMPSISDGGAGYGLSGVIVNNLMLAASQVPFNTPVLGTDALGNVVPSTSASRYPNALVGLTPNTGLAPAEPYAQPVVTGSANFAPTAGATSRNWLDFGHLYRIRENGNVTQVIVDVPVITGITGFYVSNCRTSTPGDVSPAITDTISTSQNLASSLVAGINTLTLTSPLTVRYGDYMCGRVEWSAGSTVTNLNTATANSATGETATTYFVDNATPAATLYNWTAQSTLAGSIMVVEADMTPPLIACTGDSIDSGARTSYSFSDNFSYVTAKHVAYCDILGQTMGVTTQNFGHAGFLSAQIATAFAAGPTTARAKYVVLEGGVNDIIAGLSLSTIETSWTSILTAAVAAGETPIILGVMPFAGGAVTPLTELPERDLLNAWLSSQATTYGGLYVNTDPYIGQFYTGGPAGNYWALNPPYAGSDLLHPSYPLGETRIQQALLDALAGTNNIPNIPAQLINGPFYTAVATGSANAYLVNIPNLNAFATIPTGTQLTLGIATTNTGASTLSVNGGTAYPIVQYSTSFPFLGGELLASQNYVLDFNGSFWTMLSPTASTAQLLNTRTYSTPDGINRYNYTTNGTSINYGTGTTPFAFRATGSSTNLCAISSTGAQTCGAFYYTNRGVATATAGTGVTSVTPIGGLTNQVGSFTIVGGTATTGTIVTLTWGATAAAYACEARQNGGATFYGIGNSTPNTTGMNITAANSVAGATIVVSYTCVVP